MVSCRLRNPPPAMRVTAFPDSTDNTASANTRVVARVRGRSHTQARWAAGGATEWQSSVMPEGTVGGARSAAQIVDAVPPVIPGQHGELWCMSWADAAYRAILFPIKAAECGFFYCPAVGTLRHRPSWTSGGAGQNTRVNCPFSSSRAS